ncbi:MAG: PP2C family protein-serine/threonine phosphatase [Jiangellaceae bacterium]
MTLTHQGGGLGEVRRLAAVMRSLALHGNPDPALDRVCALAARTFQVPMAMVGFVGEDRVWVYGRHGVDFVEASGQPGLCTSAVLAPQAHVLTDAASDPLASRHPLVCGVPGVRFYAGAPITTSDGFRVGTVAVMDSRPRQARADELATLCDLAAMVSDELELRRAAISLIDIEQEARGRAQAEADRVGQIAQTLQRTLLPARLPRVSGLDIADFYQPFSPDDVGGDFYDVFPIDGDGRWGLFVGDVCGKGLGAAALTSLARYSLRAAAVIEPDPGDVLAHLNASLLLDPGSDDSTYCTAAYGQLVRNGEGWRVSIAAGGHPPPMLVRAGGDVEMVKTEGTIIGCFPDQAYPAVAVDLAPADTLLLYSDGFTDIRAGGDWLGIEGLAEALRGRIGTTAATIIARLQQTVNVADEPARDDLTALAVSVPRPQSGA